MSPIYSLYIQEEFAGAAHSRARARAKNGMVLAAGALVLNASEGNSLPQADVILLVRWEYHFLTATVTLKNTYFLTRCFFELLRFLGTSSRYVD